MNIEKIKEHYEHAKTKHPYFCDGLLPTDTDSGWSKGEVLQKIVLELRLARDRIEVGGKIGNRLWNEILNCEVWELTEAIYHKDTTAAIEEAYDAIAVLLRVVDILEGRQALGDPTKESEMKKCDYCPEKAIGCRPATCPICGEVFCDNLEACPACGWCGEED